MFFSLFVFSDILFMWQFLIKVSFFNLFIYKKMHRHMILVFLKLSLLTALCKPQYANVVRGLFRTHLLTGTCPPENGNMPMKLLRSRECQVESEYT